MCGLVKHKTALDVEYPQEAKQQPAERRTGREEAADGGQLRDQRAADRMRVEAWTWICFACLQCFVLAVLWTREAQPPPQWCVS